MVIGLTGQIGAGKSTAADILESFGAIVIDADRIGHEVVRENGRLQQELKRAFGADIFDTRGRLLRKKLAARAFADATSKQRLNDLVHPYLLKTLRKRVTEAERKGPVVIDAALLLYWEMDEEVDLVLVIHAGWETRLQRLRARGISAKDARARQAAQLPYGEFRDRSDRLMLNNKSRRDLKRKLAEFWQTHVAERV
ncbi:dephospho-CoA kinase [candidate division GN15 bacterium]|nr:dephospho-CoA kinase [candidate division GN15 bacterium]